MGDNDKIPRIIFLFTLLLIFTSCTVVKGVVEKKESSEQLTGQKRTLTESKKKSRQVPASKAGLFVKARELYNEGKFDLCMSLLAEQRSLSLSPVLLLNNLYLSGLCQLKRGDTYRAKYFFKRVIEEGRKFLRGGDRRESERLKVTKILAGSYSKLGMILYRERLYDQSLGYMDTVVKRFREYLPEEELSEIYLMMSDTLYHRDKNVSLARFYFKRINPNFLKDERDLYGMLQRALKWQNVRCASIKLADENISVLTYDGNDLWIGTWNGGLARYNMYRDEVKVFKSGKSSIVPKTVRVIKVIGQNVWVGSYEGLSYYSKRSGKWYVVKNFTGRNKTTVEAIETIAGKIYVGTLGRGLWVLDLNSSNYGKWRRIKKGGALKFINCLARYRSYLIIGSMDKGVFFFNVKSGRLINLADLCADFTPVNITTFLIENENSLWIGTYGKGLYNWNPKSNLLKIFTKENGFLSDDWVLDSGKGRRFLYFGTFGGGVVAFDMLKRVFKVFTLESGLDSMDVSSVAVSRGVVAFGTLGMGISFYFGETN